MKEIFFCTFILFFSCTNFDDKSPNKTEMGKQYPDQELWDSVIFITQNAQKVAEVWAGYMAIYKEKEIVQLRDSIHVDFYNQEGKHNSVLTADSGIVDNKSNNLTATGNVIVVSDSGIVLETDILKWDNEREKIISDLPVRFMTKDDTLIGKSFISDPDLKNYEIREATGYSRRKIQLKK
jgi:LPS export ABC transporter protein LptC